MFGLFKSKKVLAARQEAQPLATPQKALDLDEGSAIVTRLAETFVSGLNREAPNWQRAFFRFEASDLSDSCNGSYQTDGEYIF
jgi:hypothetical protein